MAGAARSASRPQRWSGAPNVPHAGGGPAAGFDVLELERGHVDPATLVDPRDPGFGLLVLDGFAFLELEAGRGRVGWLIGKDDLIRPWQLGETPLTDQSRWRVLAAMRIAILGRGLVDRPSANPGLVDRLLERATRTTHWLLAKSLVLSSPLVEERLLLWFALAGERWGRVTPDGVLLDLPLTHDLLAALVGARRPTVTLALQSLETSGLLLRGRRGWLIRRAGGDGPVDRASPAGRCLQALGLALHGDAATLAEPRLSGAGTPAL